LKIQERSSFKNRIRNKRRTWRFSGVCTNEDTRKIFL